MNYGVMSSMKFGVISWSLIWNLAFNLLLGRVRLNTCMMKVAYSIPSVEPLDSLFSKAPDGTLNSSQLAWKSYLRLHRGLGHETFYKSAEIHLHQKISASSARIVHFSKSFLESVARAHRTHTHTHTHTNTLTTVIYTAYKTPKENL